MVKFTNNNQKEKKSRIEFERLVYPWDCSSPEHDVGIDLMVQPFDENERSSDDLSLKPFKKRFLVQLKSTDDEIKDIGKISIDLEHLSEWSNQADPVMIARYYIKQNKFYYTWISEVNLKENQTTQTIYLDKVLDDATMITFKEQVLMYLDPLKVGDLTYEFDPSDPNKLIAYNDIENIRSNQQLQELTQGGFFQELEKKVILQNQTYRLQLQLVDDPKNLKIRFQLAVGYIQLEKYEEAMKELGLIIFHFQQIEAKILFNILKNNKASLFDGLEEIRFVYYMKWKQETPPGTSIVPLVYINGNEYRLGDYNEAGVILPVQEIKSIQLKFELKTTNQNLTPILYRDIYLMRGILNKDGCILYEFGELVQLI